VPERSRTDTGDEQRRRDDGGPNHAPSTQRATPEHAGERDANVAIRPRERLGKLAPALEAGGGLERQRRRHGRLDRPRHV
jgi:hypothetical protein